MKSFCLFVAFALLAFGSADAQTTAFTYQGRLDDAGAPAAGIYDLRFAIFDASTNGNQIASALTNSVTGVSNGLFTATLDFGAGIFSGSNYWLEIAVRTNGGTGFSTVTPRQQITPTPYALYTPNAGKAAFAITANSASTANAVGSIANINVAQLTVPNTTIPASGTITVVNGFVVAASVVNGGAGYITVPAVSVSDATGSNAVITATITNGAVTSLTVQGAGNNYSSNAVLVITAPPSNAIQTFGSINNFTGVNTFSGTLNVNNLYFPATTGAGGIIYSSNSTLLHAYGTQNFFAGVGAGNLTMNGYSDVGIGPSALQNNTTGFYNAALGYDALQHNTTGSYNVANGAFALQFDTTGVKNVGLGYVALANNNGSDNTAVGSYTMYGNTSGGDNTAIGQAALNGNSTGNNNTAAGYGALYISTGSQNSAFGVQSLENLQTGAYNLAFGYQAGANLTNGNNDIYLGNAGITNESGVIRIGTIGTHTTTYLSGTIFGNGGGLTNLQFSSGPGNTIQTASTNSVIVNGFGNLIQSGASLSFIGGGAQNVIRSNSPYATVAGGQNNLIQGNTLNSFIGGGLSNSVQPYANYAVVGGGWNNAIGTNAFNSVIAGGSANTVQQNAYNSFIGGGSANSIQANAQYGALAGGLGNSVSGYEAAIAGGANNGATAVTAFVGGGYANTASGASSTVPGGNNNLAQGNYSFAAGNQAQALNNGAFVWSDGTANTISTTTNQFVARASGGVIFYTGTDTNTGVSLAAGSGSWSSLSDRNAKDAFAPINVRDILEKVAVMPLQTWHYKSQANQIRHLGPIAQDFYSAFELGEDDRHISTIDSEGIALAAIQGLNGKVERESRDADARIDELRAENAELKRRLEKLEAVVSPHPTH